LADAQGPRRLCRKAVGRPRPTQLKPPTASAIESGAIGPPRTHQRVKHHLPAASARQSERRAARGRVAAVEKPAKARKRQRTYDGNRNWRIQPIPLSAARIPTFPRTRPRAGRGSNPVPGGAAARISERLGRRRHLVHPTTSVPPNESVWLASTSPVGASRMMPAHGEARAQSTRTMACRRRGERAALVRRGNHPTRQSTTLSAMSDGRPLMPAPITRPRTSRRRRRSRPNQQQPASARKTRRGGGGLSEPYVAPVR